MSHETINDTNPNLVVENPALKKGVGYRLPEFEEILPDWDLIDDAISGERTIKDKRQKYLPAPVPFRVDSSVENAARYDCYLQRAVFYSVTKRTANGLQGQVFRTDPVLETQLGDFGKMSADIDGSGVTIFQQSQKALFHVIGKGRAGLLVDFPKSEGEISVQAVEEQGMRPVIVCYNPKQIINWRTKAVGSESRLSLVVIEEDATVEKSEFEHKTEKNWRVLRLRDEGIYTVEVYKFDEKQGEFVVVEEERAPTKQNGETFDYIPFTFIGSNNNDPWIDNPPLYDIASLNMAHYRNSADYEEAVFITGQPTPYVSGIGEEWAKEILGDNIQLGSRSLLVLPEGGNAGLIQPNPSNWSFDAMRHKEEQMVKLGAKLIESVTVQRTAKDATMQEASETSVLSMAAENVSSAYTSALGFLSDFLGQEFDPEKTYFLLNKDFEIHNLTPQDQSAIVASWMAGAIDDEEMREKFRKGGLAFHDLETWRDANDDELMNRGIGSNESEVSNEDE